MAIERAPIKVVLHDTKSHILHLVTQEAPLPSSQQYLVRVHAVGVTKGELQWPEPNSAPESIPGFDVAGTVVESPSTQSKFQPGDRIYALTAFDRLANARELTLVNEDEIAKIPAELSFVEAAAVPMSALTAREALFEKCDLVCEADSEANKNRSLLVIGASGAVGLWAVQLAKWAGVSRIVGMCGPDNVDFVQKLGADYVINHRQFDLADWISSETANSKFDIVLDGVGGRVLNEAWTAVKPNGQLLSIVQQPNDLKPERGVGEGIRASFFVVRPNGEHLAAITALIERKVATPEIDSVYALADFQQAFTRVESGRARGKVIIRTL